MAIKPKCLCTKFKRVILELEQREIIRRFGLGAKCRVSYRGKKGSHICTLGQVDWKICSALTVLFLKPKSYLVDGDAAIRDGVRIVPKPDKKVRRK